MSTYIWLILGVVAVSWLLLSFSRSSNAVWGGATAGFFIGLIISSISFFNGGDFGFTVIGKAIVIGALIGGASEVISSIGQKNKKIY